MTARAAANRSGRVGTGLGAPVVCDLCLAACALANLRDAFAAERETPPILSG